MGRSLGWGGIYGGEVEVFPPFLRGCQETFSPCTRGNRVQRIVSSNRECLCNRRVNNAQTFHEVLFSQNSERFKNDATLYLPLDNP